MNRIISNSTPIIGLSIVGKLHLLSDLYEVYVPEAVYKEVVLSDSVSQHGKSELKKMIDDGVFQLRMNRPEYRYPNTPKQKIQAYKTEFKYSERKHHKNNFSWLRCFFLIDREI